VRVIRRQAADRGAAHVHVEHPALALGGYAKRVIRVRGLGEAHAARLPAFAALVHREAPARVVLLGLADERVVRLEQLVAQRDRVCRYGAEDPAHVSAIAGGTVRTV
jgi:hypothetical protein